MGNLTAIRFAQAEDSQAATSPARAAEAAWARTDALAREAPGHTTWACEAGCAACCHLLVRVHPGEADAIAAHVRSSLPPADLAALRHDLDAVAARAASRSAGAYRRARLRCAFLDADDHCRIYDVRPVLCRVHASRSAMACDDLVGHPPLDSWLSKVGQAIHAGMGDAELAELHDAVARRLGAGRER